MGVPRQDKESNWLPAPANGPFSMHMRLGPGLILHTNVGIGCQTPWRQVEAMLLESARRTPGLPSRPEPFVLQRALGDFAVDYEINVYCDNPRAMLSLYAALHQNILDVFNEYGVQIMTPAYEGDPEQPKVVPRERWFSSPATSGDPEGPVVDALAAMPTDTTITRHPGAREVSSNGCSGRRESPMSDPFTPRVPLTDPPVPPRSHGRPLRSGAV